MMKRYPSKTMMEKRYPSKTMMKQPNHPQARKSVQNESAQTHTESLSHWERPTLDQESEQSDACSSSKGRCFRRRSHTSSSFQRE